MNSIKKLWSKIVGLSKASKTLLAVSGISILVFIILNFLASGFRIVNIILLGIFIMCIAACFLAEAMFKK